MGPLLPPLRLLQAAALRPFGVAMWLGPKVKGPRAWSIGHLHFGARLSQDCPQGVGLECVEESLSVWVQGGSLKA